MASDNLPINQLYKKKLQDFYDDIVMDIVYNYFEIKILETDTFSMFLEKNLHTIFHQYKSKMQCCKCPNFTFGAVPKSNVFSEKQFALLFEKIREPIPDHELQHSDGVKQKCLCVYDPNTSTSVLSLDIVLLCILIKSCCPSYHGHPSWLNDIKDVRNTISHLGDARLLKRQEMEALWKKLEEAALNIASTIGKVYRERQRMRIHKMNTEGNILQAFTESVISGNTHLFEVVQSTLREFGIKIDECCFQMRQQNIYTEHLCPPGAVGGKNIDTSDKQDSSKCYISWKFKNPGDWNVQDMIEKLNGVSIFAGYKIEFIYEGSIVIVCSTIPDYSNDKNQKGETTEFIRQFAEITGLNTVTCSKVEVEVIYLTPTIPYRFSSLDMGIAEQTDESYSDDDNGEETMDTKKNQSPFKSDDEQMKDQGCHFSLTCGCNLIIDGQTAKWHTRDSGGRLIVDQELKQRGEFTLTFEGKGQAEFGILNLDPQKILHTKDINYMREFEHVQTTRFYYQTDTTTIRRSGSTVVFDSEKKSYKKQIGTDKKIYITINLVFGEITVKIGPGGFNFLRRDDENIIFIGNKEARLKYPNPCAVCYLEDPLVQGELYEIKIRKENPLPNFGIKIALSSEDPGLMLSQQRGYYDLTIFKDIITEQDFPQNSMGVVIVKLLDKGTVQIIHHKGSVVIEKKGLSKLYCIFEICNVIVICTRKDNF